MYITFYLRKHCQIQVNNTIRTTEVNTLQYTLQAFVMFNYYNRNVIRLITVNYYTTVMMLVNRGKNNFNYK